MAERKVKAARRRTRRVQERAKRTAARDSGAVSAPEPLAPVHAQTEGVRKVRQGVVVSDKADKTITVRIDTARRHRRYEKIVRSSSTLHAHDENNDAHEGDTVRVIESRPCRAASAGGLWMCWSGHDENRRFSDIERLEGARRHQRG